MRTNEFIEKVVESGFTVEHKNNNGSILILFECENDEYVVATVDKTKRYVMNTKFSYFLYTLDAEQQEKLFNLLIDYANTPPEERQEEKKYYIKLIGAAGICDCIVYNEKEKHYFMSSAYEYPGYKTNFTWNEIRKFGLMKFVDSDLFEHVEVQ